jgi:hypothetical protein
MFWISPKSCVDVVVKPKVRLAYWGTSMLGSGRMRLTLSGGSTDAKTEVRALSRATVKIVDFMAVDVSWGEV